MITKWLSVNKFYKCLPTYDLFECKMYMLKENIAQFWLVNFLDVIENNLKYSVITLMNH